MRARLSLAIAPRPIVERRALQPVDQLAAPRALPRRRHGHACRPRPRPTSPGPGSPSDWRTTSTASSGSPRASASSSTAPSTAHKARILGREKAIAELAEQFGIGDRRPGAAPRRSDARGPRPGRQADSARQLIPAGRRPASVRTRGAWSRPAATGSPAASGTAPIRSNMPAMSRLGIVAIGSGASSSPSARLPRKISRFGIIVLPQPPGGALAAGLLDDGQQIRPRPRHSRRTA